MRVLPKERLIISILWVRDFRSAVTLRYKGVHDSEMAFLSVSTTDA